VPRFRPPRFVPGFDPLGICCPQLFRGGMWRRHCAPLSGLVAATHIVGRRPLVRRALGQTDPAGQPPLTGNLS
jgi:hypothetical protein